MPGYRTHATAALGCAALIVAYTHSDTPCIEWLSLTNGTRLIAGIIGGLFPDIDIKSKGQQLLYAIIIPLLVAALLAKQVVFSILLSGLAIIPPLLPHRGITHNTWFTLIAPLSGPALVWVYCPQYLWQAFDLLLYFTAGCLSHILLDYGLIAFIRSFFSGKSVARKRIR